MTDTLQTILFGALVLLLTMFLVGYDLAASYDPHDETAGARRVENYQPAEFWILNKPKGGER